MCPDEALPVSETVDALIHSLSEVSHSAIATAAEALHAGGYTSPLLRSSVRKGLAHPSYEVRQEAILVLKKVGQGDLETARAVFSVLNDQNHSVQFSAACALGDIRVAFPEAVEALLQLSKSQDSNLRYAGSRSLGRIGSDKPEVVEALISALADESESIFQNAIKGLVEGVPPSRPVYEGLVEALVHRSYEVFGPAREVLRASVYKSEEVLNIVLNGLQHPDSSVRRSIVIDVLGFAGKAPEKVVLALLERIKDEDQNVSHCVPEALAKAGKESKELLPALMRLIQDRKEDLHVRRQAIKTLQLLEWGPSEVIKTLIGALNEKRLHPNSAWMLRSSAIEALGVLGKGNADVISALLPLLSEGSHLDSVATALGKVAPGSSEIARRLIDVIDGFSMETRSAHAFSPCCIHALESLGVSSLDGVRSLQRALQHSEWRVREAAAEALGTVGKGVIEAALMLTPLLKDEFPATKKAAAKSLGKIGLADREILTALFAALVEFQGPHEEILVSWEQLSSQNNAPFTLALAALKDDDSSCRIAAIQALGACMIKPPEAFEAIHQMKDDPDQFVNTAAHRTIYEIEQQAKASTGTNDRPFSHRAPKLRHEAKFLNENLEILMSEIVIQQDAIYNSIRQVYGEAKPITNEGVLELTDTVRHQMALICASVVNALAIPLDDIQRLNQILRFGNSDTRTAIIEAVYLVSGDQQDKVSALMENFSKFY